jgi:acetylornithine/N-succinyldiaminopimelate aminotransferase
MMKLFDVYPLFDLTLTKGKGAYVWDDKGKKYLDFYGGHAVISIGHAHDHWQKRIRKQLKKLPYYSNSVKLPIQEKLAKKLGKLSGYDDYSLFLCNSGAEANENALKIASFHNGRKTVIAFKGAFHGRSAGAVAVTDNQKIKPAVNPDDHVVFLPFNDTDALKAAFAEHEVAAVILELVQGVNGIYEPNPEFVRLISGLCEEHNALFIADEIQSGYGRTGKFFAHQWAEVRPDLITMAKGMGNGFPVAGVLISPKVSAWYGMLGTTFGGAPLACAAALSVLEVMEEEHLVEHAGIMGHLLSSALAELPGVKEVRGKGLMIGVEMEYPIKDMRNALLFEHHLLTGNASNANTIRLLPPMNITKQQVKKVLKAFSAVTIKKA